MTPSYLRAWRTSRGLTQEKAAQLVALSLKGYQDQEQGRRRVGAQTVRIIEMLHQMKEIGAAAICALRELSPATDVPIG